MSNHRFLSSQNNQLDFVIKREKKGKPMARYISPGKCLTQCNVSISIKTWKSWKVQQSSQKQEGGRDASLLSNCQRNVSDIHATDTFLMCSVVTTLLRFNLAQPVNSSFKTSTPSSAKADIHLFLQHLTLTTFRMSFLITLLRKSAPSETIFLLQTQLLTLIPLSLEIPC